MAQYIKVDGEVEKLSPDMDTFTQLHKDLDTIAFGTQANQMSTALQSTTLQNSNLKPTQLASAAGRTEDIIAANKGVWDRWWEAKLRSNQNMLVYAKQGRYEQVARSIDTNYNDDRRVASIHYQEPGTGYTALHYAVANHDVAMVNLLLANNIDVMVQDAKGQTAMHLACIEGELEDYKAIASYNY
jgi:hypothetical protein